MNLIPEGVEHSIIMEPLTTVEMLNYCLLIQVVSIIKALGKLKTKIKAVFIFLNLECLIIMGVLLIPEMRRKCIYNILVFS